MKKGCRTLLSLGLFNLPSPLPLMLAGILLAWFVEFGIGYRIFDSHNSPIPPFALHLCML